VGTIKRLRCNGLTVELIPEKQKYRKIIVSECEEFELWGMVTGTYKSLK